MSNKQKVQSMLTDLGALSARTDAAEHRILKQAIKSHDHITEKIEALRPQVMLSQESADRYRDLVNQRGKMAMVIARARAAIHKS